jgi:hypothetical protein
MPRGCSFVELSKPIIIFNMEFPRADEELFIFIFYWKFTKILLKYIKEFYIKLSTITMANQPKPFDMLWNSTYLTKHNIN